MRLYKSINQDLQKYAPCPDFRCPFCEKKKSKLDSISLRDVTRWWHISVN